MMMRKEMHGNGHVLRSGQLVAQQSKPKDQNQVGLLIPTQNTTRSVRRQSTNESDDSNDSTSNGTLAPPAGLSPVTAFSRSLSGPNPAMSPLNVYSMSPRSTQFMYQYYSNPKGFYQHQAASLASRSGGGRHCIDEHVNTKMRYRTFNRARTISECCDSPPKSPAIVLSGIPQTVQNDVLQDPRRRAWSESDSNRTNMNMSRMSALKKLRRKLSRSGSLKKKKDDTNQSDSLNRSVASVNSLEKVEEGRQLLHCSRTTSPNSSKRSTMIDECPDLHNLSIHQEDETVRSQDSLSPDIAGYGLTERIRSPSNESVFTHDGDLTYQRFLEEHTCYDIMPTSCKLVVFDTRLQARKAFHALVANSVRSAPLWDSKVGGFVGMLTVTDFIKVILTTHRCESGKTHLCAFLKMCHSVSCQDTVVNVEPTQNGRVETVEEQTIETWRKQLGQKSLFANVHPGDSLLHSLKILMNEQFHGVPILDEYTGDILHVINHKRILRFLNLFMKELPTPSFMTKSLAEVKIGQYEDVATVTKYHTILDVLEIIVNKNVSAIPVVDDDGEVMDVFCKLDMISLAAQGLYHDLSMTMDTALSCRFTPLFEDEECPSDAFTRFSSPKPERRDVSEKTDRTLSGQDVQTSLSAHLNQYKSKESSVHRGHSSIKGHRVTRCSAETSSEKQEAHRAPITSQPVGNSHNPEFTAHHRVRHKSLSNPLVKCQLSDTLQHIVDLMVSTDANLLVVVGQSGSHVKGVITVSDVLYFIINPPSASDHLYSPTHIHKRKQRNLFSSASSGSPSLLSIQDGPEVTSAIDGSEDPFTLDSSLRTRNFRPPSKFSSSSDTSSHNFNDSGYTSASTLHPSLNSTEIIRGRPGSLRSDHGR